ncbi:hypothetical protein ACLB2K_008298 [Fragaria x ananassa]
MRFQRSSTPDKQKVQHVSSKAVNNDENSGVFSLASTASNLHDISACSSWAVEHPSALGSFDKMMKAAKGMRIVVFLDYDGPLSPIVDDPDLAFMSDEMRAALREVVTYFPTAVISGRSRDKVKGFVQVSNIYYAGSHGMDFMVPKASELDDSDMLFQPAKIFLPAIQEMRIVVEELVRKIEGARVEDNRFCISVHYRNIVREEDYVILEEKVKSVREHFPEFHLTRGKKVLEIRPSIEWNKGDALEYLLDTLGFRDSGDDVFPLYIGDDRTDEDAFKVIETRGQGFPIIVSSTPKNTKAVLAHVLSKGREGTKGKNGVCGACHLTDEERERCAS